MVAVACGESADEGKPGNNNTAAAPSTETGVSQERQGPFYFLFSDSVKVGRANKITGLKKRLLMSQRKSVRTNTRHVKTARGRMNSRARRTYKKKHRSLQRRQIQNATQMREKKRKYSPSLLSAIRAWAKFWRKSWPINLPPYRTISVYGVA